MEKTDLIFTPKCPKCNREMTGFIITTNPPHEEDICFACHYKKIKTGNKIKIELAR